MATDTDSGYIDGLGTGCTGRTAMSTIAWACLSGDLSRGDRVRIVTSGPPRSSPTTRSARSRRRGLAWHLRRHRGGAAGRRRSTLRSTNRPARLPMSPADSRSGTPAHRRSSGRSQQPRLRWFALLISLAVAAGLIVAHGRLRPKAALERLGVVFLAPVSPVRSATFWFNSFVPTPPRRSVSISGCTTA